MLPSLDANHLESVLDEGLEKGLVVGLQDEFGVADPQDVIAYEVGHPAILVQAFAWDDVSQDQLSAEASHE